MATVYNRKNPQIICSTCGTWYSLDNHPNPCTMCSDERQYIPEGGQKWTLPADLYAKYSINFSKIKHRLYELEINPTFAIGQRGLLVLSEQGNVLWDCIPLLDEAATAFIRSKGGLKAICLSHPHYYSNMNEWAETFDCPVYIHQNDEAHIMQTSAHIRLWEGDALNLWDGISIKLIGGHFEGSCVLHVPFLSEKGVILCGDTLFLSPSKKHFSIQRSYPNKIPLPQTEMRRIKQLMNGIPFDEFYGYIKTQNLTEEVIEIFRLSMDRYLT